MAEQGTVELGVATGTNYADHLHTYQGFLKLVKYVTVGLVILLILMAYFLL
jgi:Bacterial aa3 type cytochrome c oxidase subunit IV